VSRPSFHLHDDVERIRNVRLDGAVRQVNSALQNTARKTGEPLFRRICMNCRECAGMPGIQELQKVECFASADFARSRLERYQFRLIQHNLAREESSSNIPMLIS
jgi:hypothetical protein